jgi:hypothetical protein
LGDDLRLDPLIAFGPNSQDAITRLCEWHSRQWPTVPKCLLQLPREYTLQRIPLLKAGNASPVCASGEWGMPGCAGSCPVGPSCLPKQDVYVDMLRAESDSSEASQYGCFCSFPLRICFRLPDST